MESKPIDTKFMIVVLGETYLITKELKSLGFQWSQFQKVWYHVGGLPAEQCESLTELRDINPQLDISFRYFERDDKTWNSVQLWKPIEKGHSPARGGRRARRFSGRSFPGR